MGYLITLRVLGGLLGAAIAVWAFLNFRTHLIKRNEFFFLSLFSFCILLVVIFPDSINAFVEMLALEDRQFGRLIALGVLSNMALWVFVISLRAKDYRKSLQFDLLVRNLALERFLDSPERRKVKEISIVIPVLNEAENLKSVLPRIPEDIDGHGVSAIVVDDGSTDDSVDVARLNGMAVARNPINRGGGAALRLGFDIASRLGSKIIVTMDGDGQHLPEELQSLIGPLLKDEADFVIGSRVIGQREKDSMIRWLGIHVFSFIINLLASTKITDCSSGFRAFKVDALDKVLLVQDQFHTAELIIDSAKKGLRITEVPITIKRRMSGESKKGRNLIYGFSFLRTILKSWWR
jgi:cellulose synthase/poly-beta-1,6-N-acetylglucosamine synthase-like glycosyltransferase